MRIEPSKPEGRIVALPPERASHQRYWPTVEVVETVTVIAHETWGTRAATYEIVATEVIDIRNGGMTRDAIDDAKRRAHFRCNAIRRDVEQANPDYMKPARY